MAKRFTSKKVLQQIGCSHLSLYRGNGYWYFVFDDVAGKRYETRSVMSMYLGSTAKDFAFWVSEGRDFVAHMEAAR